MTRVRRSFRIAFKIRVIKYCENRSITSAASEFSIDRKNIRQWLKEKVRITFMKLNRKLLELKIQLIKGGHFYSRFSSHTSSFG